MKEDTKILKSFLDTNFTKNMGTGKAIELSQTSLSFLGSLFLLFKKGDDAFRDAKIENNNGTHLTKSADFDYIPISIKRKIERMDKLIKISRFRIQDRSFKVTIVYPIENKLSAHANQIRRIFMWLFVACHFSPIKCSQTMDINLYFTDNVKTLPSSSGSIIDQEHANTAFTTSCNTNTVINLFREEEWFKVLIHETFHCMGLDFSSEDPTAANNNILSIFPVKSDVRLFETYCETWAEILNVMFISYHSTRQIENISESVTKMLEKTARMLRYEKMFSIFQCTKVLHHINITYAQMHEKSTGADKIRQTRYKEKTQILSYYVLKSMLMFDPNLFIEWCVKHNHRSLKFNSASTNIHRYCDLIRQQYQEPGYVHAVEQFEQWFDKNGYHKNMELRTLRMSLFEQ
jgi:hypothetical protein